MVKGNEGVYIFANLLDTNKDGIIDMISLLSPDGKGIALAIKSRKSKKQLRIHMLQDITGDGKLDNKDLILIEKEANKIFENTNLREGQLKIFVCDAKYS